MILRKINSVFSLITTVLLLGHAISIASWMLSRGRIIPFGGHTLPKVLIWAFVAHALVSIILMISAIVDKKTNGSKGKMYPKMNSKTIVQRISGILLILFTFLHVAGAKGIIVPPPFVHAVIPVVFFLMVMCHIAVSFSKAFITLGIGNAKFIECADIGIKVICAVTVVADIIGFYLHVC
jgi:hypothetical protein